MHKPHLKVAADSGEIVRVCHHCDQEQTIEDLQAEITSLSRRLASEKRQRQKERDAAPHRALVEELFEWWQQQTGHTKSKLTPDRFDAIERLLRDYSREQMMWMVVGVARYPWELYGERYAAKPANPKAKVRDEWDFIAAKGRRAEELGRMGYLWMRRHCEELPDAKPTGLRSVS